MNLSTVEAEARHGSGAVSDSDRPREGAAGDANPVAHVERSGTQSLARGIRLMRMIAARPQFGWRLSDLAAATGLDKGTVRRMLICLVDERLVQQHSEDRRYFPGPMMYELGLALPHAAQFQAAAEGHLNAMVQRTGLVALLLLRSGSEYVCSLRAGTLPLSGLMVAPGTRRPLFTAVGGVAILQALAPDEAAAVLEDNIAQEIAKQGTGRLAGLQRMRERSARHGFGVNLGDVVPGVHAFGLAVRAPGQGVFCAVCLIGTTAIDGDSRIEDVRTELETCARALEQDAVKFSL